MTKWSIKRFFAYVKESYDSKVEDAQYQISKGYVRSGVWDMVGFIILPIFLIGLAPLLVGLILAGLSYLWGLVFMIPMFIVILTIIITLLFSLVYWIYEKGIE
jgi:hypothetical protein